MMHIGTPATGSNFFGRTKLLNSLLPIIKSGSHVLLSGPRRVGKTSLAKRLLYLWRQEGWDGIYVTFEGAKDETIIAQRIISELKAQVGLWDKINQKFNKIFSNANIDLEGFGLKVKYKHGENEVVNLLETLGRALNDLEENYLIVIDELPVFLVGLEKLEDGPARVEIVLNTLRSYRQTDSENQQTKKVWFFCGSISLESFAANRNLSYTINDIRPLQLGAYEDNEAIDFLNMACKKHFVTFVEGAEEYLLRKVGWPIPFYLAIIFEAALLEITEKTIGINHINVGYNKALSQYKKDFDLWLQRLNLHIKDPALHIDLLKQIAVGSSINFEFVKAYILGTEWRNISELQLISVLDQLISDGYIVVENGQFQYRSPLIRDYISEKFHLRK